MKSIGGLLKIIVASCLLWGCVSTNQLVNQLKIGFSAEENERIFVTQAILDDHFIIPVGRIGCCMADAGAIVGGFQNLPQHLSLQWIDRKTGLYYFAHLDFPADLEQQIRDLPQYFLIKQNHLEDAKPYLVVSIDSNNQAFGWLSNARSSGDNIRLRKLIELARQPGDLLR